MFSIVAITFVITTLIMALGFVTREAYKNQLAVKRADFVIGALRKRISDRTKEDRTVLEQKAYEQGLYDGRETDALYRKLLSKHSNKEQFSILMGGLKDKEVAP